MPLTKSFYFEAYDFGTGEGGGFGDPWDGTGGGMGDSYFYYPTPHLGFDYGVGRGESCGDSCGSGYGEIHGDFQEVEGIGYG